MTSAKYDKIDKRLFSVNQHSHSFFVASLILRINQILETKMKSGSLIVFVQIGRITGKLATYCEVPKKSHKK